MKKATLLLSLIASLGLLVGCSSSIDPISIEPLEERKMSRMTVVSSARPVDVLPAFKSFTWNDGYSQVLSAVNENSEQDIQQYIRNEIIRYLHTKGYTYQSDPIQADVVIGFLFALEDDLADQQIQDKFGLLPGISSHSVSNARYEKGSLVLAVLDTRLEQVYWRAAMQGFVDFEKDRSNADTEHMQTVLKLMMRGFPEAGK